MIETTDSPEVVYYPDGKPLEKEKKPPGRHLVLLLLITFLFIMVFLFRDGVIANRGIVSGIIYDSQRQPVAGAWVYINDLQTSTLTGADGSFRLEKAPSGMQFLVIEVTPSSPVFLPISIEGGNAGTDIGEVILSP